MKAVVDASPLIFLAKLDALDLLPAGSVTTREVLGEVEAGGATRQSDVVPIQALVAKGKLPVIAARRTKNAESLPALLRDARLGAGERSVLHAAVDHGVRDVILDDRLAIRTAKALDLTPLSTPFLLLRARLEGKLGAAAYGARLDGLFHHGYRLSPPLYRRLVEKGGNQPGEQP